MINNDLLLIIMKWSEWVLENVDFVHLHEHFTKVYTKNWLTPNHFKECAITYLIQFHDVQPSDKDAEEIVEILLELNIIEKVERDANRQYRISNG